MLPPEIDELSFSNQKLSMKVYVNLYVAYAKTYATFFPLKGLFLYGKEIGDVCAQPIA